MLVWIIAVLAIVASAACLAWALHMRRERSYWMQRCNDSDRAVWDIQDVHDSQQGDVALAAVAADAGARLQTPAKTLRQQQRAIDGAMQQYQRLVQAYDDAVQYCLQPVDLLPGADNDTMEQLIEHVSSARRRLFAARSQLLDNQVMPALTGVFDQGRLALAQIDALAGALRHFADDGDTEASIDVNDLLASALLLAQVRVPDGVRVIKRLEVLPPLAHAPWLGSVFLRLLSTAAAAAGEHGNLIARTRYLQRHIEVHIMGHASMASADALERQAQAMHASVELLQQQLDRYGASLQIMPSEGHGHGFVLCLPVRSEALAA
ncbi:MAG: hypothetical protein L0H70_07090 [Xanthomonadales bacterium]|nr:hypothetical protein [Xanthomonadales bacterium]